MDYREFQSDSKIKRSISYFMNTKNWWGPLVFILIISVAGVTMIGYQTYHDAPPMSSFVSDDGRVVVDRADMIAGQEIFHKYGLMEFGSMFGDGAQRGPDFTAEALHMVTVYMNDFYTGRQRSVTPGFSEGQLKGIVEEEVRAELKRNRYDEQRDVVVLSEAQEYAVNQLREYYTSGFASKDPNKSFIQRNYIKDPAELRQLSDFFFWGAWVCVTERPGTDFSYTHNWPYDAQAGNTPTSPVILWSVLGLLGFVLACGIVLYFIGQYNQLPNKLFTQGTSPLLTSERIKKFTPTPSQKATYKFFVVAVLLFFLQVTSGFLTINEFVDFLSWFGISISEHLPVTVTRSWHLMLSLYWISTCWIASSIFILPLLSKREIPGQVRLVNWLFGLLFVLVLGSLAGMFLGPMGLLGEWWYWFGSQGWEYVDFGKASQVLLMVIFILWMVVVYRGLKPAFVKGQIWTLPRWIMYSVIGIPLLFISGFVATPETNFVIADFWRWMVVHMWVEAFFEVFITVIVSYLLVLMGLVSKNAAIRVVYIATILFLGTGLLGISHNFYWNAKPVATMALGSVFSTLQFVPLILLTVEAWRFKNMPELMVTGGRKIGGEFGFPEVFLFLIAVNFWNFFGAGVMGIIINLPLMNYFEHGTYLTVNHGHAALMGVYGNISLAAILFAAKLITKPGAWNTRLVKFAFWGINIGLMLMVMLDLFPAGAIQFKEVVDKGLWFARSESFIKGETFETLTWLRGIGATVFYLCGVIPLAWFLSSRSSTLKKLIPGKILFADDEKAEEKQEPVQTIAGIE